MFDPFNPAGGSGDGPISPFKPMKKPGWGIQPIEKLPGGGDIHDTFHIDRGNIEGGHTTVQIPGREPLHLPWKP